uniref:Uncharacterized protein n=1 Tax=Anolis carolinensis TaxID=28377 RepID=A0A803TYN9_ANOCA
MLSPTSCYFLSLISMKRKTRKKVISNSEMEKKNYILPVHNRLLKYDLKIAICFFLPECLSA